jgi:hypothetical protein
MSLHRDLLDQARHLAGREPRRPKQASLRRAISTAYYALYHLLVAEGTRVLIRNVEPKNRFTRAFEHANLKNASRAFANPQPTQLPHLTGGAPVPSDLEVVANAVIELQEARHEADYNVGARFSRLETKNLIGQAKAAFEAWKRVRTDPIAHNFLAALLL